MDEFTIQLSNWLPREELQGIIKTLKGHKGKTYILKRKRGVYVKGRISKGYCYAVWIKDRRKKEKKYPKLENMKLDVTLDRFILLFTGLKKSGIGIFKVIETTKLL